MTSTLNLTVSEWIERHWRDDLLLREWWELLADAGYSQPTWPVGLGGTGATRTEALAVSAAIAAAGKIAPPSGNGANMAGPTILAHGTAEQQARYVGPIASGAEGWAQLFSEPGAGSDLAGLSTSAVLDGDELVINGQKVWNSFADRSERGMLLARTNRDVPKHQGITWMVLDMDQPGVEVRPLRQMNGVAEFCEVFMTDARVPLANVIGGIDEGWNVARTTLAFERAGAGSGKARGAIEVGPGAKGGNLDRRVGGLVAEAEQRANDPTKRNEVLLSARHIIALARQVGATTDPVLRQRLADFHIHTQLYTLTGRRGRDNAKSGRPGPEGSTMKLQIAMLAHESRDLSLAVLGAGGMLSGADAVDRGRANRAAMSSFAASLGGGTNEIQRNIIAERSLGLPREPADDHAVPFSELRRS